MAAQQQEQTKQYIKVLREDPTVAARELLCASPEEPLTFWWGQRSILRSMMICNFVMTVAGRGLGKCSSVNSYIQNQDGLIRFNELYKTNIFNNMEDGEENIDFLESKNIWNGEKITRTSNVIYEKNIDSQKISTHFGYDIEVGYNNHKILIWNKNLCEFIWKYANELSCNDILPIQRVGNFSEKNSEFINTDSAYFVGLMLGDGCYLDYTNINFTNNDDELKDWFLDFAEYNNWNIRVSGKKETEAKTIYVRPKSVITDYLNKLGLDKYVFCEEKQIPLKVRQSKKECIAACLSGLFDTDGCAEQDGMLISFCNKSYSLVEQIHLLLLMFGIVSKMFKKEVNGVDYYIIQITGKNIDIFKEDIGFKLKRKQILIEKEIKRNTNLDIIPGLNKKVRDLSKIIKEHYPDKTRYWRWKYLYPSNTEKANKLKDIWNTIRHYAKLDNEVTYEKLDDIIEYFDSFPETKEHKYLYIMKDLLQKKYFFDNVIKLEKSKQDCCDHTVLEGSKYWCNGSINHNSFLLAAYAVIKALLFPRHKIGIVSASFRQSKFVFAEIKKIYQCSPILQAACTKPPVIGSDSCYLEFKSGSLIMALPLGDGETIRGARFHSMECDEAVKIPKEILEVAILPMMNVFKDPMISVQRAAARRRSVELGIEIDDSLNDMGNQIIFTTTAWFQFSELYTYYKDWKNQMLSSQECKEISKYAVFEFPYTAAPEGFLDMDYVRMTRNTMSAVRFAMENLAFWPPDTDGFFPASLFERCKSVFPPKLNGSKDKIYIMGVDPARESDNFITCVSEIDPVCSSAAKLVYMESIGPKEFKTTDGFGEMHEKIRVLFHAFPTIARIMLDQGGGGLALRDMLSKPYNFKYNGVIIQSPPLLQIAGQNEQHDTLFKSERRAIQVIDLVPFTTEWINDAAWELKSRLEQKQFLLPTPPRDSPKETQVSQKISDEIGDMLVDIRDIVYLEIEKAIEECTNIVTEELPSRKGYFRFTTATKSQKKDRWASLMLNIKGIADLEKEGRLVRPPIAVSGLYIPETPRIIMPGSSNHDLSGVYGEMIMGLNTDVEEKDNFALNGDLRINSNAAALR